MAVIRTIAVLLGVLLLGAAPLGAQVTESPQGVAINFVDTDIRAATQMLSAFLDRPVMFGAMGGQRVSFVSARPVPRSEIPDLLRSLLAGEGYVLEDAQGGTAYQIRAVQQPGRPGVGAPGQGFPPPQPGGPLAAAGGMELHVIRLSHARATDVAATVNALYGRGGALGEPGGFARGTLNDQLAANRAAAGGQPGQQQAPVALSGELGGNVVIVPDTRTNSLLVRASQADFALIRAAVTQVDVRPLQVLIEATVAYVRRDFRFNYGVQAGVANVPIPGTTDSRIEGETVGMGVTDLVIRALNVGGVDLDLILRAGQSRSSVIILDRPLLLAANNEEAEIVVGEQRPFIQVQRSTDGGVLDAIVSYKDVGTVLRVLPTISSDGYVQLRVIQEVNSASGTDPSVNAPVISTRAISTQLLVRDGHTVVLGGLTGRQRGRTRGGVPFLSDLPLIGGVFGRRGQEDTDFELFIFLTPHVVYADEDLLDATGAVRERAEIRRSMRGVQPMVQPADESSRSTEGAEPGAP
jgi:type II secretory pathway component GspD/PulD (secretin)